MHHECHIPKQLVEFPNRGLDGADFGFAFYDEGFLEIDFGLVGEVELVLLLFGLLRLLRGRCACVVGRRVIGVGFARWWLGSGGAEGGAGGGGGGTLFIEGEALKGLEFGTGGLEFSVDLLLGVFLRGLFGNISTELRSFFNSKVR